MDKALIRTAEEVLQCPITKKKLVYNETKNSFIVESEDIEYSIIDGIIDFVPEETNEHIDVYAKRAKRYERIFKHPGFFVKVFDKFAWGITHKDYAPKVINYIPKDFNGIILDIPVGTGTFSTESYSKLPKVTIIVADYSINMIKYAKRRYSENSINNIIYIHVDVGNIPIINQNIDILISMNGFHAFPEKDLALTEIARVLKPEGRFLGCFFIRGIRKRTDIVVNRYYSRKGWFQPPYYTLEEIITKLGESFNFLEYDNIKSMFVFNAQKR